MSDTFDISTPVLLPDGRTFTARYDGFDGRHLAHAWRVSIDGLPGTRAVFTDDCDGFDGDPAARLRAVNHAVIDLLRRT